MSASKNEALIKRFYRAFAELDSATMVASYAPEAKFEDPVFTLNGREEIGSMWTMLAENVKAKGRDDWKLDVSGISADANQGKAHWEPRYRFSASGRLVHNIIDAEFQFKNGLIVAHRDRFSFWRWSRQALGPAGLMLGWTPILLNKVRATAAAKLAAFVARRG